MRSPFTQIYIHLIWSTWDREALIHKDVKDRLYSAMAKRCNQLKCQCIAIGGMEDHVHILVSLNPAVAIAALVKDIKGASSHLMNHEILPGKNFRWQGAYGAFSIRENEVDEIKKYILNQTVHHIDHTLFYGFELTEKSE